MRMGWFGLASVMPQARSVLKLLGEVRLSFDLNWMTRGYGRLRIRICTRWRAGLSPRAVNRIRLRATVGCEKVSLGKMAFTSMVGGGFFEAFSIKDISPKGGIRLPLRRNSFETSSLRLS